VILNDEITETRYSRYLLARMPAGGLLYLPEKKKKIGSVLLDSKAKFN